jgi:NAD-dependent dihydropyrimidine dehydrogenase PreA subunit
MAHIVIDPLRCEGNGACVGVCPSAVLAMRPPDATLPLSMRLRVAFHGGRQARVVDRDACTACLRCMTICPEQAIQVRP